MVRIDDARQAGEHLDRYKPVLGAVDAQVTVELGCPELVTQDQRLRAGGVELHRLQQLVVGRVVDEQEGGGREFVGTGLGCFDREQFAEGYFAVEEDLDVGLAEAPLVRGDDVHDGLIVRIAHDAHLRRILRVAGSLGPVARIPHHQDLGLFAGQGHLDRRQCSVVIGRILVLHPVVPGGMIADDLADAGELALRSREVEVSVEPGLARVEQAVHIGVADIGAVFHDRRRIEVVAGLAGRCVVVGDGDVGQRDAAGVGHHVGPDDLLADGDFHAGGLVGVVAVRLVAGPFRADERIYADSGLFDRSEIAVAVAAETGGEVAREAGGEAHYVHAAVHGLEVRHELAAGRLEYEVVLVVVSVAVAELLYLARQQHAGVIVELAEDSQVIAGYTTDQVPGIVHLDVEVDGRGVGPADYYRLGCGLPLGDWRGVERVEQILVIGRVNQEELGR